MKSTVIALTVAAALGAGSIPAFARDHGGDHDQPQQQHQWQQHQWQQRADQRFERHERHERWSHAGPRYYVQPQYRSYYYQPQPYYAPGYYSYDDGADDVIGGAILGALAGGLVGQLAAGR
jgi:hypothetical protein